MTTHTNGYKSLGDIMKMTPEQKEAYRSDTHVLMSERTAGQKASRARKLPRPMLTTFEADRAHKLNQQVAKFADVEWRTRNGFEGTTVVESDAYKNNPNKPTKDPQTPRGL
jgi:hypothetical protein